MFDVSLARLEKGFPGAFTLLPASRNTRGGVCVCERSPQGSGHQGSRYSLASRGARCSSKWTNAPELLAIWQQQRDVPHILDTAQHETLPLGIDLVWKLTEVLKSDEDVTGSFFRNDVCDEDSVDALSAKRFIMDVTAGSDYRATRERWLNVSMGPIMNGPDFKLANRRHICNTYNTDEASVTLHGCDVSYLTEACSGGSPSRLHWWDMHRSRNPTTRIAS
ncbi:hypothetical protein LTR48_004208 [Friedmanniomyces endolithicus]|uniref:Uncharacterized protein n=1 Tax=Rachicladosporium monterosium TaxID=1507873 RepID=A0ABR0LEW2_9PEZI|nr:hypothetical protein LTR29_017448 [Friedmanniomyces endolithicus]KAK1085787.1 hypothetical protein LTR48_004208 [Friedmanniomyces endolithicus]KAK5147777.1 hypothetical protein LTR32_000836 [Rachicladosporium monterosium]